MIVRFVPAKRSRFYSAYFYPARRVTPGFQTPAAEQRAVNSARYRSILVSNPAGRGPASRRVQACARGHCYMQVPESCCTMQPPPSSAGRGVPPAGVRSRIKVRIKVVMSFVSLVICESRIRLAPKDAATHTRTYRQFTAFPVSGDPSRRADKHCRVCKNVAAARISVTLRGAYEPPPAFRRMPSPRCPLHNGPFCCSDGVWPDRKAPSI